MLTYAGIGSRQISLKEEKRILTLAYELYLLNYNLLTGNANGTDVTFQKGSRGNYVAMMPYKKFNLKNYDPYKDALNVYVLGKSSEGIRAANQFHPAPENLDWKSMPMMARNYHQIMGYDKYPVVSFVVCCATEDTNVNIVGGTGQAVRIAKSRGIPVFNLRTTDCENEILKMAKFLIL